ncbi:MAG: pilus assembly protein PilM, partial [Planctomycetota bacterium]
MFKRRKSIVGLDIGSSEVKAIELTDFGDTVKITGFGCGRVDAPEHRAEVINEVLQTAGIKTRRVATAVSGRSVIVRYIALPPMTEEEVRHALPYEADKYIPFDTDEVSIDGQILEEFEEDVGGERKCRVLMVAVKKDLLQEHSSLIMETGLIPVSIDI